MFIIQNILCFSCIFKILLQLLRTVIVEFGQTPIFPAPTSELCHYNQYYSHGLSFQFAWQCCHLWGSWFRIGRRVERQRRILGVACLLDVSTWIVSGRLPKDRLPWCFKTNLSKNRWETWVGSSLWKPILIIWHTRMWVTVDSIAIGRTIIRFFTWLLFADCNFSFVCRCTWSIIGILGAIYTWNSIFNRLAFWLLGRILMLGCFGKTIRVGFSGRRNSRGNA